MYTIEVKISALKEITQISTPYNKKIIEAIENLTNNTRPDGVKKLKGEKAYRIRVSYYDPGIYEEGGLELHLPRIGKEI